MKTKTKKAKIWYGDAPNRRCSDCGERVDWDERLRLGLVPIGGPTQSDGITPTYSEERRYGNTPEGEAEQAKLEAHVNHYHRGGLIHSEVRDGIGIEVYRYDAYLDLGRQCLKRGLPFYRVLSARLFGLPASRTDGPYRTLEAALRDIRDR